MSNWNGNGFVWPTQERQYGVYENDFLRCSFDSQEEAVDYCRNACRQGRETGRPVGALSILNKETCPTL